MPGFSYLVILEEAVPGPNGVADAVWRNWQKRRTHPTLPRKSVGHGMTGVIDCDAWLTVLGTQVFHRPLWIGSDMQPYSCWRKR